MTRSILLILLGVLLFTSVYSASLRSESERPRGGRVGRVGRGFGRGALGYGYRPRGYGYSPLGYGYGYPVAYGGYGAYDIQPECMDMDIQCQLDMVHATTQWLQGMVFQ